MTVNMVNIIPAKPQHVNVVIVCTSYLADDFSHICFWLCSDLHEKQILLLN